ncbi:shikimate dehydrogenase family protein [Myroides injenensis]|uniref:shikimate dehydrogenase family protein n=1 Tax=Myroides injenensis TaxID=1183151 RepID=UPI00227129D4|nr:shikimate dehydrogenase [Myroides injenensis]
MTKRYGLIGKNIDYSFSRNYFTERFKKKRDNKSIYVNFDIENITLFPSLFDEYKDIKGLNVTIPYKQAIIPYLDEVSKIAKKIGAVNTIQISKKGKLKGYNTDWYGFYHSIKPLLKFQHKKALILGTGGASKAIEYALTKLKIQYLLVSRTKQEGVITYEDIDAKLMSEYTIVINTTPIGTFPNLDDKPHLDYSLFTPKHIAYDLIYNPEETTFLRLAKEHGAKIKNGYEMLVLQAERAWEIWNK